MKRLLYIAYHFPPHGGAGVQRSLKFVKYLPSLGIMPTVLTDVGASDRKWSPPDQSLASEIPPEVTVIRTAWPSGTHPNRAFAEERRFTLATQAIAEQKLEAIFVSMSPFADTAFAARLSAHCGIPWIADLRDPWALDEFQVYRTRWHRQQALRGMRCALSSASLIVMNTPEAAASLTRAFPEFAGRTVSVTNGYDAEDLTPDGGGYRSPLFTIVHAGFLHSTAGLHQRRQSWRYRLLGQMEAGIEILPRSHYYLLQALAQWRADDPSMEEHVRLLLVGESRPIDRELVAHSPVASLTSFTGYLPHLESVRVVREAGVLFLPMHKLPRGRRATIVPGKTYEYLASGRPILASVPAGDAREFLSHAGTGLVCEPGDVGQMVALLRKQYRTWLSGEPGPKVDLAYIKRFERKELARQLVGHLNSLKPLPVSETPPPATAAAPVVSPRRPRVATGGSAGALLLRWLPWSDPRFVR